jgi:hypothetical protein
MIRKVALVSHDYNNYDSREYPDYSEHFHRINKVCDDQGCDTVLYSLFTWHEESDIAKSHGSIFRSLSNVDRVVLEVYRQDETPVGVECWHRNHQVPQVAHQRFATSSESATTKARFVEELESRCIDDALLMICGESNIVTLSRADGTMNDDYGFTERLKELSPRLILNPIHDYMRRPEMKLKRKHYSIGGRTVLSVWNMGKGKESSCPWTAFHDGAETTDDIVEVETPFADRPDIRIGVYQVV